MWPVCFCFHDNAYHLDVKNSKISYKTVETGNNTPIQTKLIYN